CPASCGSFPKRGGQTSKSVGGWTLFLVSRRPPATRCPQLQSGRSRKIPPAPPGRCYAFQNNNRARTATGYNFAYLGGRGANLRMTEFQGNLLLAQMTRLEEQSRTREQNAQYLTSML